MRTGILNPPQSTSRQRWFVVGLVFLFVALSVQYTFKAVQGRSAFVRWRDLINQMDEVSPYERSAYPNPPVMAVLLEPLAELKPWAGALCWFYLKAGMTLLALYWVFRLIESPGRPFPPWAKVLTVLLSIRPIMGDLFHGNVNLFILFLVIAFLYAFHQGRDWTSGVVLALAVACKVTPALFIPYFLWKRAWKVLAGCTVGLVLFLVVIPGFRLGMHRNVRELGNWANCMVVPFVVGGQVTTDHPNQSLPGLLFRLATHSPSFSTYDEQDRYTPLRYNNWLDLDPSYVRWILKGCMGVFALLIVWRCRTPTRPRDGWRLAAEFSLITLGMLLFSERTWKHHCVTFLLPFAILSYYLSACGPGWKMRCYLIGTLAAVVLLMASTSTGLLGVLGLEPNYRGSDPQECCYGPAKLAQVYGAFVWCYLIMMAAILVILRRPKVPAPGTPASEAIVLTSEETLALSQS